MERFLIIFLILSGYLVNAQSPLKQKCDSIAKVYLANSKGSLVIGVYNGGIEKVFYYGETVKGNSQLPDSNSIYELGNLSETFTSILFADRTLKGVMHIDDKLQSFLPVNVFTPVYRPLVCKPMKDANDYYGYSEESHLKVQFTPYICTPDSSVNAQPVLLCYLASHTSGFPPLPSNFNQKRKQKSYSEYSIENLYEYLRLYRLENPIGFDYRHSETGIALLGLAISRKMEKDFETVLVENFLDPMKMNDTRIHLSSEQKGRLVQGYDKDDPAAYGDYNAFAPVKGLHSSASDMMKFLEKNISLKKDYIANLLDYTHNPRLTLEKPKEGVTQIALGWKISPSANAAETIVWQSGLTEGFSSFLGFIETSHLGIFILSSVSKKADETGLNLLRSIQSSNKHID